MMKYIVLYILGLLAVMFLALPNNVLPFVEVRPKPDPLAAANAQLSKAYSAGCELGIAAAVLSRQPGMSDSEVWDAAAAKAQVLSAGLPWQLNIEKPNITK